MKGDSPGDARSGAGQRLERELKPIDVAQLERWLVPKAAPAVPPDSDQDAPNTKRSKPAHRNVILPCFSREGRDQVFESVGLLIELHPSRFFVVDVRPDHALQVFVGVPAGDNAGSQVVLFECSDQALDAVVGLLRAHMLVGVPSELALFDGALTPEGLEALLPLADGVLLESSRFDHLGGSGWGDGRAALYQQLLAAKAPVIDNGWLALSTLREEIRHGYERCGLGAGPWTLDVYFSRGPSGRAGSMGKGIPTVAALLVGWCVSRLGGDSLVRTTEGARAIVSPSDTLRGTHIDLAVRVKEIPADDHALSALGSEDSPVIRSFTLAGESGSFTVSCANNRVTTSVTGRERFCVERSAESQTSAERWRRYFVIGESITNYRNTLEVALPLFR